MGVGQNPVPHGEYQSRWQMEVHPPQNGASKGELPKLRPKVPTCHDHGKFCGLAAMFGEPGLRLYKRARACGREPEKVPPESLNILACWTWCTAVPRKPVSLCLSRDVKLCPSWCYVIVQFRSLSSRRNNLCFDFAPEVRLDSLPGLWIGQIPDTRCRL